MALRQGAPAVRYQKHAAKPFAACYRELTESPGPVVVGAAQGASCFGPAYEFVMILDTDLRRRRIRHKVPLTFVTSEPYVGHLGLGRVGDSRGLLESKMRERDIKWIANAKIKEAKAGEISVVEHGPGGEAVREHAFSFKFGMILPAFRGVDAVAGAEEICNARGFLNIDSHQRNPKQPAICGVGVCVAKWLDRARFREVCPAGSRHPALERLRVLYPVAFEWAAASAPCVNTAHFGETTESYAAQSDPTAPLVSGSAAAVHLPCRDANPLSYKHLRTTFVVGTLFAPTLSTSDSRGGGVL